VNTMSRKTSSLQWEKEVNVDKGSQRKRRLYIAQSVRSYGKILEIRGGASEKETNNRNATHLKTKRTLRVFLTKGFSSPGKQTNEKERKRNKYEEDHGGELDLRRKGGTSCGRNECGFLRLSYKTRRRGQRGKENVVSARSYNVEKGGRTSGSKGKAAFHEVLKYLWRGTRWNSTGSNKVYMDSRGRERETPEDGGPFFLKNLQPAEVFTITEKGEKNEDKRAVK